jgi:hypothetical protein
MKRRGPPTLDDLVAEARCDGPSPTGLQRLADEAAARTATPPKHLFFGRSVSRMGTVAVASAALLGVFAATKVLDATSAIEPTPGAVRTPSTVEPVRIARGESNPTADDVRDSAPAATAIPTIDVRSLPPPPIHKNGSDIAKSAPPADDTSEGALLHRAYVATPTDPRKALALTVEHARRFPSGMLAQEREVIAIESLVQLGRNDQARARASSFLAAHPGSAYQPRIDEALGRSIAPRSSEGTR